MTKVIVLLDKLSRPFVYHAAKVLVCRGICGNLPPHHSRPGCSSSILSLHQGSYDADKFCARVEGRSSYGTQLFAGASPQLNSIGTYRHKLSP